MPVVNATTASIFCTGLDDVLYNYSAPDDCTNALIDSSITLIDECFPKRKKSQLATKKEMFLGLLLRF